MKQTTRQRREAEGKCRSCENQPRPGYKSCLLCAKANAIDARLRRLRKKVQQIDMAAAD